MSSIIEDYLRDNNMTIKEFAKQAGVTQQTIKHLISGDRGVDMLKIIRISRFLGVSLRDFVKNILEKNPQKVSPPASNLKNMC